MDKAQAARALLDDPTAIRELTNYILQHYCQIHTDQLEGALRNMAESWSEASALSSEERRVLRHLKGHIAFMAIAEDQENAVVVKNDASGHTVKVAVLKRSVAERLITLGLVSRQSGGKVPRFAINQRGREFLRKQTHD